MRFFRDLVERTLATYVEAFITLLLLSEVTEWNASFLETVAWSAVPAALAVIKSALASLKGDPNSASLAD